MTKTKLNLILNAQSLNRMTPATPGDLLRCQDVQKAWSLGVSPQELNTARRWDRDETSVCHSPMPSRSSFLLFAFLLPQRVSRSRAEQEISVWFVSGANPESARHFPLCSIAVPATWHNITPSRASLSQPGAESAFLPFTYSANSWRFFSMSLLFEVFHKSFYICSACAKILLHVLKIQNSGSCNGIPCTLHFHSLIGTVWLRIVSTLTRAKSKFPSCQ